MKRIRWKPAAGVLALATCAFGGALWLTPFPQELATSFTSSAEFLDREGRPLRTMLVEERRFTKHCELAEISPQLIAATLSAEDQRFRIHPGVDPLAIARATLHRVSGGHTASGASTITQQLVKLARPGPRTLWRKLTEAWLAVRVECTWSKERILTEYLNRLDYGNLQVGISAASRFYFGKPASDLSTAEAAFLAALPKAPSRLNPHIRPQAARERQHWVLGRMRDDAHIDASEYSRATSQPLKLGAPGRDFAAPHFVDLLLKRRGILPQEGGPVRTTLDLELNRFAERVIAEQLRAIADKHATSAAAVVIHNASGDVLALAGSGDYFQDGDGQINAAWMVRSPGSAVKPFTYLLALERGANPCSVVPDVPTDFPTDSGLYRPNNYNHRFYGPVSLRFALGNSLNVGAIRALQLAGGPDTLYRRMWDLGFTTLDHESEYYGLGLTLGNGEVRLLELTNAYAALGRLGVYRPYRLLARDAAAVEQSRRISDPRATYLLADMLADNLARSSSFGLDSYLAFDFPVACKTGTSSDYRDNWAVGFTPEYTVGVWVGNSDGSTMRGITGVTGAAPIMHELFVRLHEQYGTSWFHRPEGILDATVHPLTGRAAMEHSAGAVREKCLWPPEPERSTDFDERGRAVLSADYVQWLASPQNTLGDLATCSSASSTLRILNPPPGTVFFLDPDLPLKTQRVPLRAAGNQVEWSSETLRCEADGDREVAQLSAGRHVIHARDKSTGVTAETWIEVRPL